VWSDGTGNLGVHFTALTDDQRVALDRWLAQRYFTQ
jgi:hypothetical protein